MTIATAPVSANWEARLELVLRAGPSRTSMVPVKRFGPLSVQRPFYPEGETCHVYLLHPPGGVVGGDQIDLQVHSEAGTSSLMTTPGATKFYYSAGETAMVNQQFEVRGTSSLEYLPQENIYFPGARVNTTTMVELGSNSHCILWEKHCFGRPANHEVFDSGELTSKLQLKREGQLLFTERQHIDADEIQRCSGLRGHAVIGTTLVYSPSVSNMDIQAIRDIQPLAGTAGISRLDDRLLVIRYLGTSMQDLNQWFIRLWNHYRFMVNQRWPCQPRIWNT